MSSKNKRKISRRKFLEGTGVALVAAAEAPSLAADDKASPSGPRTPIRVTVNGATHRIEVEDRWTLVELLRDRHGQHAPEKGRPATSGRLIRGSE